MQINSIVSKAEYKRIWSRRLLSNPPRLFCSRSGTRSGSLSIRIAPLHLPSATYHFDIIRNIFLLCRPVETDRIMRATDAPVLVTHVCSHWRSVALTVPQLWTTIYIDKPKEKHAYQLAWKFLERSRDPPNLHDAFGEEIQPQRSVFS